MGHAVPKWMLLSVVFLTSGLAFLPAQAADVVVSPATLARLTTDKLPTSGVYILRNSGEYLGYSAVQDGLAFKLVDDTGGYRESPDEFYLLYRASNGQLITKVQADFDRQACRQATGASDEAMDQEAARLRQRAESVVRSWQLQKDLRQVPWTVEGMAFTLPGNYQAGAAAGWRFCWLESRAGWAKPLAAASILGYSMVDVSFQGSWLLTPADRLVLVFTRSPVMEFDTAESIYVIVDKSVQAQFWNEVGYELYVQKDYRAALARFNQAAELWPDHATAVYNAACCSALLGDQAACLISLKRLKALAVQGSSLAADYLRKVARDTDFDGLRRRPEFVATYQQLQR